MILATRLAQMPKKPRIIAQMPGVWLVGGAACWLADENLNAFPKDWDFIVEPSAHQRVLTLLHTYKYVFQVNSFGGVKATGDGIMIDVWLSSLSDFITNGTGNLAVNVLHSKVVTW